MPNWLVNSLRESAAKYPEAEAIVHHDRRVRYSELWAGVTSFACFLRAQGIQSGNRVAILLDNSPEYVVAYYGTLLAGGVVVALNTAAKAVDLSNWLAHCDASWLVLDTRHAEAGAVNDWCHGRVDVVAVNGVLDAAHAWKVVLATPGKPGLDSASPDALAAIIYTSGTTGRPKGVMLSHGNLATNVESILAYLELGSSDRILNVLPFYYSYGNSVLHTHLAVGGCVVIEDNLAYPHRVLQHLSAERATGFSGVPSTFALLLSRVKLEDYDLSSLRYLTQAGGPMPPVNIERLRKALPQVRLFIMYGQTEATARLSYLPPERLHDKLGSIGIAIPGVTLDVRHEQGTSAAPNEVGEIWARGGNIMPGYWNDPEATQTVLCEGWLRTGDMAYCDADGYLFIQGRMTDMIKSGAHRIHPKEIEEAIAELAGVGEVAVVGVPDEILGQVVKAYILPKPGVTLDPLQVKAHCHKRLASYKTPKSVEFVKELPKTASGKIKKFLLVASTT
jgi:acyl-CoA synthetase (AMP-forming)/AMP-acid ligase II